MITGQLHQVSPRRPRRRRRGKYKDSQRHGFVRPGRLPSTSVPVAGVSWGRPGADAISAPEGDTGHIVHNGIEYVWTLRRGIEFDYLPGQRSALDLLTPPGRRVASSSRSRYVEDLVAGRGDEDVPSSFFAPKNCSRRRSLPRRSGGHAAGTLGILGDPSSSRGALELRRRPIRRPPCTGRLRCLGRSHLRASWMPGGLFPERFAGVARAEAWTGRA